MSWLFFLIILYLAFRGLRPVRPRRRSGMFFGPAFRPRSGGPHGPGPGFPHSGGGFHTGSTFRSGGGGFSRGGGGGRVGGGFGGARSGGGGFSRGGGGGRGR